MNRRSQAEIVADMLDTAERLEKAARATGQLKHNRERMLFAARVLRVTARRNSIGFDVQGNVIKLGK